MNKPLLYLLTTLLLLSISCSNNAIEQKLQLADSLLQSNPDSSLAVLKRLNSGDICNKKQGAEYALLYTAAQYKLEGEFEDDLLISTAVKYYGKSEDKQKYASALMYKGAVLTELGVRNEALKWYKQAEEVVGNSDSLTLGLIYLRMGELYQYSFIENHEDIEMFKKAATIFKQIDPQGKYEKFALSKLGQLYRKANLDSAQVYLTQIIDMCEQTEDIEFKLFNQGHLADIYYYQGKYNDAKKTLLNIIYKSENLAVQNESSLSISRVYANLNKVDSALYYLKNLKPLKSTSKTIFLQSRIIRTIVAKIEIAKAQDNYKKAYELNQKKILLNDSIDTQAARQDLYYIDKYYDKQRSDLQNTELKAQNLMQYYVITIIGLLIIMIIVFAYIIINGKNARLRESLSLFDTLKKESLTSRNTLADTLETESQLKNALDHHIQSLKQLINSAYVYENNPTKFIEKFKQSVALNKFSEGVWQNLRVVVDHNHNGILTHLQNKHIELDDDSLNMIGLICCEFSNIEISMCMGYTNERSFYSKRTRIAKRMGLEISLDSYIKEQLQYIAE